VLLPVSSFIKEGMGRLKNIFSKPHLPPLAKGRRIYPFPF
jgi:hypothetical protein